MRTDLHIIASCTKRKRAPVPPELRLRELRETTPDARARRWWSRLHEHPHPPLPAESLYAGEHWRVVLELPSLARQARLRPRLWVASAGYGLIPSDAPIRPYSATFSRDDEDSVGALSRQWWMALAREAGPAPGEPRLLHHLARASPDARILVVASPSYIGALEEDLALAARALHRPEHLLVISAPGPTSRGVLAPHWVPSSARLQAAMGGTRNALSVRIAKDLLRRAHREDVTDLDAARVQGYYGRLIHRSAPPPRLQRTPMTDDEVRRFIAREMRTEQRTWSAMLRRLRDSGLACEQQRFRRLFHELQERP
ncbi:hypothetical protein [Archangium lipolyticum]|uniref:hypothetical protein n=1 Tax=Archangium lipolyticum TaxID=2970465 RepID=UPI00214A47C5|nr:hypothetical protein [Archangium lipolyticum]